MQIIENIALALAGLKANKMRALLTMLGIIIGVAAVIAIVSVGDALTYSITGEMEGMGATNIYVMVQEKGNNFGGPQTSMSAEPSDDDLITLEEIEEMQNLFSDRIDTVSLDLATGNAKAQENHLYANIAMIGVNDGYKEVNNIDMISGRFIADDDLKAQRNVCIVSDKFVKNMFPSGGESVGKEVKIYNANAINTYTIIGVYKHENNAFSFGGMSSDKDITTNFYYPITVAKQDSVKKNYQMFSVFPKTGVDVNELTNDIEDHFKKLYEKNPKWTVSAMNMESQIAIIDTMLGTVSVAIGAIAAISLLVGGIGVMNIMLVSVTERTREIGTRKALGAKKAAIKMQFIVESAIICSIGGIIGVVVGIMMGYFASGFVSSLMATSSSPGFVISWPVILISVGFSMLVGIFFGYYPANKASKLDPIEALRYE